MQVFDEKPFGLWENLTNLTIVINYELRFFESCNMYSEPQIMTMITVFHILQAIVYEGQDKNPEMCRVLLTHEIMCR